MINTLKTTILAGLVLCLFLTNLSASDGDKSGKQDKVAKSDLLQNSWKNYKGIKLNIDESGKAYVKLGIIAQAWYAHSWNNPGTLGVDGQVAETGDIIGLRRSRFTLYSNLYDKLHLYTQVGVNNQILSSGGAEPQKLYLHDFWLAYTIKKNILNVGAGLNYWNGISRLTNRSATSMLLLDYPNFIYPNLGHTDQIARQMGIFAYGNIKALNYRVALTQPFLYDKPINDFTKINESFEIVNDNFSYKGYFSYNFFEKEYSTAPFYSMNCLGTRKLLNIGAGFDVHPGSVAHYDENSELVKTNRKHFGLDVYLELPQSDGSVLNVYSVGYKYDFGPNYLRSVGLMQPALTSDPSLEPIPQGPGVKQFYVGTGTIWYTNVGYLLPDKLTGENNGVQPFVSLNYKDLEGLSQSSWQYDAGLNYFIYGNHFKLTAQYSTRPVYTGTVGYQGQSHLIDHKGAFIFQVQVAL